ncbi:MAG: FAD-dependent oxidoreductase [Gemmatimonadetes bacterium]|nr:FAD-dependent oxidoreductase [Gemmatimonadota bacterium]
MRSDHFYRDDQHMEGTHYNLVIYGGNPAGLACAVRAAREGLTVLLVNHTPHIGGLPANGMGLWDTLYEGWRSPIYNEMRQAIFDHYRNTYGKDSPQYAACLPGETGHSNGKYEARVFEQLSEEMIQAESNITLIKSHYPTDIEQADRLITAITFTEMNRDASFRATGDIFVDTSYEGDLLPLANVAFRVGRESKDEFNEPHAGRIFMRFAKELPESEQHMADIVASLNLRQFGGAMETIMPDSTGEGDGVVQAMNFRTALSSDPNNQVKPEPPEDYDPARIKTLLQSLEVNRPDRGQDGGQFPNNKSDWNRPQLIEGATDYVHGDWPTRQRILKDIWNIVIGILYFFQNDPDAPENMREAFAQWGLAKDEFPDNNHMPWEIYVREARRLEGRYMLTEHDVRLAEGIDRAPIHSDTIAICEWYTDVHACHPERVKDSRDEGKVMLHKQTVPGQIPYRSLLANELDNFLVPVCLSSSHLGQSAIRLEPTWMQIAESAGYAAVQAIKNKQTPADIDIDQLQQTLAEQNSMLTFLNDIDLNDDYTHNAAIQWAGTKGFFDTYDARPQDKLDQHTAHRWIDGFVQLCGEKLDTNTLAHLTRGEACQILYDSYFQQQ